MPVEELEVEEVLEDSDYYDEEEEEEEHYSIEWLSDQYCVYLGESHYDISYAYPDGLHSIKNVCYFRDCPSYCGGLIITDIKCDVTLFKKFVQMLKEDTPYSQLICGDVNNEIFLTCGAINLGGVLILEIANG